MSSDINEQQPAARPEHPATRGSGLGRWDAGSVMVVINGVLAGITGVFVTTKSIAITVIACTAAVALAALILLLQHRAGHALPPAGALEEPSRPGGAELVEPPCDGDDESNA